MLMIRFQRVGKKNEPSFRIVLTEKTRGPQKKYLEELGFYNPRKKTVQLKSERILYWLSKGAKASPSCHNLLIKEGVISGSKIKKGKIVASSPMTETEKKISSEPVAKTDLSFEVSVEEEEKTEAETENEPKEPENVESLT